MESFVDWLSDNWSEIGSITVSVLAAVFAGFALGHSRGQRDASVRQAIAAESQVDLMRRQLVLAEQELELGSSRGTVLPYVPPWMVNWEKGDTYSIVNGGYETEYDVNVKLPPNSAVSPGVEFQIDSLDPRSSQPFMFAASLATPHREILISWSREPGGERREWRGQIPRKQ